MKTPRVIFKDMPIARETDILYRFLFHSNFGHYVLAVHPDLKACFTLNSEAEKKICIKKYVAAFRKKNRKVIARKKAMYKIAWKPVERKAFRALSEIMQCVWTDRVITAYLSINPICPRFLSEWSFSVSYRFTTKRAKDVILHESCHFLYFKKWKEMWKDADPKTFNSPYLEWKLSELVAPILLNDPRVNRYIGQPAVFYPEHTKLKIGRLTLAAYFNALYVRLAEKDGFELFLHTAYREARKHSKALKF